MATIIIQLDPATLSNPDADIRYVMPDLLIQRLSGRVSDDGYDYVGSASPPCVLQVYLHTDAAEIVVCGIIEALQVEQVLGNDLSRVPIAVQDGEIFRVVHPPDFRGTFWRPRDT